MSRPLHTAQALAHALSQISNMGAEGDMTQERFGYADDSAAIVITRKDGTVVEKRIELGQGDALSINGLLLGHGVLGVVDAVVQAFRIYLGKEEKGKLTANGYSGNDALAEVNWQLIKWPDILEYIAGDSFHYSSIFGLDVFPSSSEKERLDKLLSILKGDIAPIKEHG